MNARTLGIAILLLMLLGAVTTTAQEFLDTAGRWKSLTLPPGGSPQAAPRAMIALRGHVVIGREGRGILVSRDSGETWRGTGDGLPSEVRTVWALAHPDTIATPQRILGVASTTAPGAQALLIESMDGGDTWRNAGRLPDLDVIFSVAVDTMRLYGPPAMLFVDNASGVGRTGLLTSAAGLHVSTDGGATWLRRGAPAPIRALAMRDESNGIAALGEYRSGTAISSTPGGIAWTSDGGATWTRTYSFPDGGFFQHLTLAIFSPTQYRAFVPERFQNYMDWRLLRSSDAGRTWGEYRGRQARRPLYGRAFWRDTSDLHVVSDGAILQHAADGGELFYLLRDTTNGYWQTPLDLIPGYVTRAPIAATDGRYLYFTVPGNRAARWRMASIEPLSAVEAAPAADAPTVLPNPVGAGGARVELGALAVDAREVIVVDLLGRARHAWPAPHGRSWLELPSGALAAGRYVVVVRGTRSTARVPFVVAE